MLGMEGMEESKWLWKDANKWNVILRTQSNNLGSTTPSVKAPTVIVAPPFPGTAAFKVGYKTAAALIVERALVNAGLLPQNQILGKLTAEDLALVPVYQAKYPGLKKEKGIGPFTYSSMTAKAGS